MRPVELMAIVASVVMTSEGTENSAGSSTTCDLAIQPLHAEWLDTPKSSFSPERQRPFAAIRGGSTDNRSDLFQCRSKVISPPASGQQLNSPYARWGKSYSAVRSLDDMDDDDDTFFTSRPTRIEGSQSPYHQTESAPEPRLPIYPQDYPVDSPTSTDDYSSSIDGSPEKESEFLLKKTIGEELDETGQILSRHLSYDLLHQDGKEGTVAKDKFPHSPVVYRYFGRSVVRTHRSDSTSFILIGPCVDHWKSVGQILASRGFNVMACERVKSRNHDGNATASETTPYSDAKEGENLVLSVLEALRWNKAIVVGCDDESHLAVEAALRLAPKRIAGLVLCGELSSVNDFVAHLAAPEQDGRDSKPIGAFSIDSYLRDNLDCPFAVVWDGGIPKALKGAKTPLGEMLGDRCLVLGGGTAPHRRLPEQFAWVLTRFVEEKVATQLSHPSVSTLPNKEEKDGIHFSDDGKSSDRVNRMRLPPFLEEFFSPGTFIVAGRVAAAALFYVTALKVVVYQYDNVRSGMLGLRSSVETVSSWQKWILQSVFSFVHHFGNLPQMLGRQRAITDSDSDELLKIEAERDEEETDDNELLEIEAEDEEEVEDDPSEEEGTEEEPRHIFGYYLDRVVV